MTPLQDNWYRATCRNINNYNKIKIFKMQTHINSTRIPTIYIIFYETSKQQQQQQQKKKIK